MPDRAGGGVIVAKYGANMGVNWVPYYAIPAQLTVYAVADRFQNAPVRAFLYVVLAGLSAPAMHYGFSILLGWNEYMPFCRRRAQAAHKGSITAK